MPISEWLHYGDHTLAPLRRSSTGSYPALCTKGVILLALRSSIAMPGRDVDALL